jgi:secreted trypsin-like serine protease
MPLAALLLLSLSVPQAGAITGGEVDTEHINVGAILVRLKEGEEPVQWCSGTLIHPRVFLTAGHCVDPLIRNEISPDDVSVSFNTDAFQRPWQAVEGFVLHPEYSFPPVSDPHDLGLIILKQRVDLPLANLAPPGFLDELWKEGKLRWWDEEGVHEAFFTVVGYGVDEDHDDEGTRKRAESRFMALTDAWLMMSQVLWRGDSGTCFGDSGGPTFYVDEGGTEWLVAITSWGEAMCWATGNNYRIDLESSHRFIESVIAEVDMMD